MSGEHGRTSSFAESVFHDSVLSGVLLSSEAPRRSRDLGEVPRWLGVQQSGLFERRLSDIMGVHRYVGFHFDQQQQGSTSGTFDNTFGRASIEMPREWRARSDFLICGVGVP